MNSVSICACAVAALLMMAQPVEVEPSRIAARFFMGYRRAPLPFPYQLVMMGREMKLCDYEGRIAMDDVASVGYDDQYLYVRDVRN